MAAVVNINRLTGTSPGSATDITGINSRANAEDTHTTAGTSNPVSVPTSGTNYSFWASTQLEVISGLGGVLDNIKWFTSGTLDTGVAMNAQDAASYVEATGVVGTSGDQLIVGNYASLTGAPVDATTLTTGSPKTVPGSTSGTGVVGNLMVYQFAISATAVPGAATPMTATWRYDET